MTNLVQFPGLGLSFELSRVAFSIGGMDIYWYGVCIAFGLCLALVFAFRRCTEFGIDADSMVDVILIGVVLGIASARLYYVAMAPYDYDSIWDVLAVRDGGLAIYGGIIGAFVFGGLAYVIPSVQTWNFEVGVAGTGFLALAVMIFGQWKPFNIFGAAMFFAVFKSLANIADSTVLAQLGWSSNIYNMMPFIASMVILAFTSKNSQAPKAEGIPYDKGSR